MVLEFSLRYPFGFLFALVESGEVLSLLALFWWI
jgi:hypothetical protein